MTMLKISQTWPATLLRYKIARLNKTYGKNITSDKVRPSTRRLFGRRLSFREQKMTKKTTKLFRKIEIDARDKIAVTNLVFDTGQNIPARELKNSDMAFLLKAY